jgi:hypothetical protein
MASPAREATKNNQQRKPLSITEVIAAAADVVIARPLLMLAPILLDIYYLAGWRLTSGHTFDHLRSELVDRDMYGARRLVEFLERGSRLDLTGLPAFVVPSLMPDTTDQIYQPVDRTAVSLDNWGAVMLVTIVMLGLAMFLFGFVGLWLADSGLNRNRSWGDRARLGPVIGGRFVLLALLCVAMFALLLSPFLLAAAVASTAEVGMESMVVSIGFLIGLVMYILFFFAPDSLLVDLSGPVQALRSSSAVVRRNLPIALFFVVVQAFLSIILADVWDRLATNAPGLAIAVVANAFVGCVLWIASLLFFSERSKLLASERAASSVSPSIS